MQAVRSRWLFDRQLRRDMNTCTLCAPVPSHSLARCRCVFACTIFTPWLGCRSDSIALATGGRSNMGMDLEAWLLVSVRLDCKRQLCWIPAAACPTSWMDAARRKSQCFPFLFWHCFLGYVDATQATNWSFHSDLFQVDGWFPPSSRLCVARTRFVTCAASLFLDFAMEGVSTEVLVVLHELEPSWRVPFALCVVRSAFRTSSHPLFRLCCSIPISLRIAVSHAPFAWCIG